MSHWGSVVIWRCSTPLQLHLVSGGASAPPVRARRTPAAVVVDGGVICGVIQLLLSVLQQQALVYIGSGQQYYSLISQLILLT